MCKYIFNKKKRYIYIYIEKLISYLTYELKVLVSYCEDMQHHVHIAKPNSLHDLQYIVVEDYNVKL